MCVKSRCGFFAIGLSAQCAQSVRAGCDTCACQLQERITGMNILVCTPGRLLQHLDETVGFDTSALQILVKHLHICTAWA